MSIHYEVRVTMNYGTAWTEASNLPSFVSATAHAADYIERHRGVIKRVTIHALHEGRSRKVGTLTP